LPPLPPPDLLWCFDTCRLFVWFVQHPNWYAAWLHDLLGISLNGLQQASAHVLVFVMVTCWYGSAAGAAGAGGMVVLVALVLATLGT
jgi:hypothetical protein